MCWDTLVHFSSLLWRATFECWYLYFFVHEGQAFKLIIILLISHKLWWKKIKNVYIQFGVEGEIKGTCSEIFGKLLFFKLTDRYSHFSNQYIIQGEQIAKFFSLLKVIRVRENNFNVIVS